MAILDQEHADPRALTQQRFERMTLSGKGDGLGTVSHDGLPPGPRWPALLQTIGVLRYRHWFHPWLFRTYGDTYTVRLLPKGRPLVFFTRPEQVKEIFAGDPEVFHAGKGNAILGPVMGEHSLLLQDGADHKRARKLLMPAFNGHALRSYQELITAIARDEVAHWPEGPAIRSLDRMNAVTLEVILRVVFGVTDEERLAALRPRVNATVNVGPGVLLVWTLPRLQRFGPWKAAVQNQIELDELMYAEIRDRRTAPDLAERTDVLSRLIREGEESGDRLSDIELRDQLVTLLLAGHETTATALAWALHELARHPDADAPDPGRRRRGRRGRRRLAGRRAQGVAAAAPGDPGRGPDPDEAADHRRHRPPARRHGRAVDPGRARPLGQLPRPRAVRPRALPRPEPAAHQHLDPVRRRRAPLHRRRLLADGGRGRAARGVHARWTCCPPATTCPRSATSPRSRATAPGSGCAAAPLAEGLAAR